MTTRTHIGQVAQEGLVNKEAIMRLFDLSELEYNTRLFNCGIDFLEVLFPSGTSFEEFYYMHSRSKLFWSWFRRQYEIADQAYLRSRLNYMTEPKVTSYDQLVQALLTRDIRFQNSFNNYLNALKNHEKSMF